MDQFRHDETVDDTSSLGKEYFSVDFHAAWQTAEEQARLFLRVSANELTKSSALIRVLRRPPELG